MAVATGHAGSAVASPAPGRGLRKDFGRVGLMFTSVGSVIGSGWLLGALNATKIAGPAAIISWVVGAAAIMLLAFIHAELGGMHAVNGGVARFPHYAFGSMVGFGMGWVYWLGSVTLAPVETEAALQYADKYVNEGLGFHMVHEAGGQTVLTGAGYAVAAVLMLAFTAINLYGAKRLSETNTAVVWWKIAIPSLTIVTLLIVSFSGSNFSAGNGFDPAGAKGILSAIASGGVIFAYLGFEQAIQFGGETANPQRNIPFAVIGAMAIGTVVYILLELAFVGALNPASAAHGWSHLSFTNDYGPYAALASGLGLGWLAVILYIDAFLSPAGTGLVYSGSSARVSYALGRNGYIPEAFDRLSKRGVPWVSILFSFAVGMIVFLPFPGWQKLVAFVTSAFGDHLRRAVPFTRRDAPPAARPSASVSPTWRRRPRPHRLHRVQPHRAVRRLDHRLEAVRRDRDRLGPARRLPANPLRGRSPADGLARVRMDVALAARADGAQLPGQLRRRTRRAALRRRHGGDGGLQPAHLLLRALVSSEPGAGRGARARGGR